MKKTTKKTYLTPQVKTVSFIVEGGFVDSLEFKGPVDPDEAQLENLQSNSTDYSNIFGNTL